MQWGSQLIFTYGPLGFITHPVMLGLSILLVPLFVEVLYLGLLVLSLRRLTAPVGRAGSWLQTFAITFMAGSFSCTLKRCLPSVIPMPCRSCIGFVSMTRLPMRSGI